MPKTKKPTKKLPLEDLLAWPKKTKKRTPSKTPLTPLEVKWLQSAARQVWEECAYDLLQLAAEEGQETVSRAEAIEISLDAGRPEDKLRAALHRLTAAQLDDRAAITALLEKMKTADYDALIAAVRPVFPFARYGM